MLNILYPKTVEPRWLPGFYTKPLIFDGVRNYRSNADFVPDFTVKYLKAHSDFVPDNSPFRLTAWQQWLCANLSELNYEGYLRYRMAVVLVGRKNGKTELAAIKVLEHLLTAPDYAEIISAAVTRTQARFCFDKVKAWILESPELSEIFVIKDSASTITNSLTGTTYKAVASDSKAANGSNPYFIVIDELHAWDDGGPDQAKKAREFFNVLITGSGARKESQVLIISTAGENPDDSLLGDLYRRGKRIASGEEKDETFGFFCWEVPKNLDPLDENNWDLANPNLAEGFISIDYVRSMLNQFLSLNINSFFRYHLNQWCRVYGENFISEYHWDKIAVQGKKIGAGRRVIAGVDGSKNNDSTGIVIIDFETGLINLWEAWEKPDDDENWVIQRDDVKNSLIRLRDTYDVIEVWVDKYFWETDFRIWAKELNMKFQNIPQTDARLTTIGNDFIKDVVSGTVSHDGDPVLRKHVLNAVRAQNGKPSKDKHKSRHKIDLLMCAIFACYGRDFLLNREKTKKNRGPGIIGLNLR